MSKLYKPTTREAYLIAAALLNHDIDSGMVESVCKRTKKSPEESEKITKAIRRLAESLIRRTQ